MSITRRHLAVILAVSLLAIGGALFSQYVGGLQPCELCLLQRWPYYLAIPLAGLGLALFKGGRGAQAVLALCALLFLADAGIAAYHVGVEQHWVQGPTACTGSAGSAKTIEELRAQIMAAQPVRCDEPQFALFGVTMAGWNVAATLFLAGIALRGLLADRKNP